MIKVDSFGNVQWRKTYGDRYIDVPCFVVQLGDSGFALGGTMTEAGTTGAIGTDLGIVRTDSAGNQMWAKVYNAKINETWGWKSEEFAYSMCRTKDGAYVIAGTTTNSWDGSHVDIFFVKTESLEQPPEPSPPPQSLAVSGVSGSVKVQSLGQGDAWTQANDNASLSQGSKIKTEEEGGTVKLGNITTLEIQPNTLIEVEALTDDSSTLLLQEGEFTADVEGLSAGGSLKVDMSQAVAEITGTVFTVAETGTESTLSVKEGSVAFTSKVDGETVTVEAGQKVTATVEGLGSILTETGASGATTLIAVTVVVSVVLIIVAILGIKRKRLRKPQAS